MLNKYLFTAIILILLSFALHSQHVLYFTIPECPNPAIIEAENSFVTSVYPNPSQDYLTIMVDRKMSSEINSIDIIDSSGKTISTFIDEVRKSADGVINLSISEIPGGMYFVLLKHNSKTELYKFIKLKN